MKIRIHPWFTDACSTFLNNLFKWYPETIKERLTVLEWGGGNSTIYFLQNQCQVLTVESNDTYINYLATLTKQLGYKINVVSTLTEAKHNFKDFDLTILKADKLEDIGEDIFDYINWSIILNDGISRLQVLEAIKKRDCNSIVILDNAEYCANWGKLEKASAHPDRVKSYRQFLRDPQWQHYIFEQSEGREGHSAEDATGWEAPHRWLSAILWKNNHLLAKLMVTNIGFPLVSMEGIDDEDLNSLSERCPFDWQEKKWLVDEYTNVFSVKRKFE